jgi:hypothetical protein
MSKFSIIAVDYEHHVPRQGMINGLNSLANQTFKDFELIICHDGTKEIPYEEEVNFNELGLSPIIINTEQRMNDWGHSSRDMAMKMATGEYFIQFNIDNKFYPEAFEKINNCINDTSSSVVIFTVVHSKYGNMILTGIPPIPNHIDCMQLVAHRNVWQDINYWYNKTFSSDGLLYQEITSKYKYVSIKECLGENY